MMNEPISLISSCALFAKMYDAKTSLYELSLKFIECAVLSCNKTKVSLDEICACLKEVYAFDMPKSVLKRCLNDKKLKQNIKYETGDYYSFSVNDDVWRDIKKNLEEKKVIYEDLFNSICAYVREKNGEKSIDENSIKKSIENFLLGRSEATKYEKYVPAFFCDYKNINKKEINSIKEGYILYNALSYEGISDGWHYKTNILLSLENIFSIVGYNSYFYNKKANEFLNIVNDINKKENYISLFYPPFVREDIENYFKAAEAVVEAGNLFDPTKDAMRYIYEKCSSPAEVVTLKLDFYEKLKSFNIKECPEYDDVPDEYNLVDKRIAIEFGNEQKFDFDEIYEEQKKLSYINMLRGQAVPKRVTDCKYLYVTEKRLTRMLAAKDDYRENGSYRLAVSMDDIFSDLWFYRYKGFSPDKKFITLDALSRAQMIISTNLSENISKSYDKLKDKFEKGEIDDNKLKRDYIELLDLQYKNSQNKLFEISKTALMLDDAFNIIENQRLEDEREMNSLKESVRNEQKKTNDACRKLVNSAHRNHKNRYINLSLKKQRILLLKDIIPICYTIGSAILTVASTLIVQYSSPECIKDYVLPGLSVFVVMFLSVKDNSKEKYLKARNSLKSLICWNEMKREIENDFNNKYIKE